MPNGPSTSSELLAEHVNKKWNVALRRSLCWILIIYVLHASISDISQDSVKYLVGTIDIE